MSAHTILVIEDDEDIRALVMYNLRKAGYEVKWAADGGEGLRMVRNQAPALVLLDLMLPSMNGLEVCALLKNDPKTCDIPIVMLTAKGAEQDLVTGFEHGADDYVTKPFSPKVLAARVQAVLRRGAAELPAEDDSLHVHDLVIHPGRHEVLVRGKPVKLTFTEFRVLHCLARRPGWVFTRSQIVDAVRGAGYAVTDRAVDVQIVGLRKKLGKCGHYIETVRGIGYRFKE